MRGQIYLLTDKRDQSISAYDDASDAVALIGEELGGEYPKGERANTTRLLRSGVFIQFENFTIKPTRLISKGRLR